MADVVHLKEWQERTPRRAGEQRFGPAAILLFTGVRYERLTPTMLAATQRRKCPASEADTARRN